MIAQLAVNWGGNGQFVSCVAHLTSELKKSGLITDSQKRAISKLRDPDGYEIEIWYE